MENSEIQGFDHERWSCIERRRSQYTNWRRLYNTEIFFKWRDIAFVWVGHDSCVIIRLDVQMPDNEVGIEYRKLFKKYAGVELSEMNHEKNSVIMVFYIW